MYSWKLEWGTNTRKGIERTQSVMAPKKKTPAAPVNDEEEELLDFEDAVGVEEDANADANGADGGENGDAGATKTAGKGDGKGKNGDAVTKKGYVGIHSTGFRDFLLKPELLRAIVDCGFEHPSEGTYDGCERVKGCGRTRRDCEWVFLSVSGE